MKRNAYEVAGAVLMHGKPYDAAVLHEGSPESGPWTSHHYGVRWGQLRLELGPEARVYMFRKHPNWRCQDIFYTLVGPWKHEDVGMRIWQRLNRIRQMLMALRAGELKVAIFGEVAAELVDATSGEIYMPVEASNLPESILSQLPCETLQEAR